MSISLNVVRSAAVFCAAFSRSAMRSRSGLIGTASSTGPAGSGFRARCSSTSSLSSRPPGPLGGTCPGASPCCPMSRSAEGMRRGGAAAGWRGGGAAGAGVVGAAGVALALGAFAGGVGTAAGAGAAGVSVAAGAALAAFFGFAPFPVPSARVAISSPIFTTSPFFLSSFSMVPETGAGSSSVALSDSISTTASSRSTESPSALSQAPIWTSVIDSPTSGTLSSTAMRRRLLVERGRNQPLLLDLVAARGAARGRRRFVAADDPERMPPQHALPVPGAQVGPGAHVPRLLLDPRDRRALRDSPEQRRQGLVGERIELLQAQDCRPGLAPLAPRPRQLVVDLSRAEKHPLRLGGRHGEVADRTLEAPRGQIRHRRHRLGISEQALRGHDHQRLPPGSLHLPPKQVEILRGGRGIRNLDVVPRRELEESLDARAGVFRAQSLPSVRQKQHQPREAAPL